ncbi:hypothetical protein Ga0102493_112403 [Erythrobacter litoralis]|uniref:Lipoprotein n=1 Tax=Erythrobacter litoralis TaxID=39960 RepID=A0A074N395_9SPHN|nr:hypothetical protein [Erythrobacter litoralis]AOL23418.1 hypothetical protein Ga0102493_112403 [Erythrobacter litoralis]KEO92437.1 hypothetical protein EH32_14350 [Erythrobacter litoralis]
MSLRGFLAALLALLLGGCWIGNGALFAPDDLASVELDGHYEIGANFPEGSTRQFARFEALGDGRTRIVPLRSPGEPGAEFAEDREALLSLVAIPGAANGWYLAFVSEDETEPREVQFYIARYESARLALHAPNCDGTPRRDGMERLFEDGGSRTCRFTTREALLDAAREGVAELSASRIFPVEPVVTIVPADNEHEIGEDEAPE